MMMTELDQTREEVPTKKTLLYKAAIPIQIDPTVSESIRMDQFNKYHIKRVDQIPTRRQSAVITTKLFSNQDNIV